MFSAGSWDPKDFGALQYNWFLKHNCGGNHAHDYFLDVLLKFAMLTEDNPINLGTCHPYGRIDATLGVRLQSGILLAIATLSFFSVTFSNKWKNLKRKKKGGRIFQPKGMACAETLRPVHACYLKEVRKDLFQFKRLGKHHMTEWQLGLHV